MLPRSSSCSALLYFLASKKASSKFLNFETITLCQIHNKIAHGDKLIGSFYYTFHGFSNKTRAFLVSASPKSISDKRAAKNCFYHTIPSSELQRLPRSDPGDLCANTRNRLLATHSFQYVMQIRDTVDGFAQLPIPKTSLYDHDFWY